MAAVRLSFKTFKPTSLGRFTVLLVVVVVMHWVVLNWLREHVVDNLTVTLMPQPLFVRVIQPVVTAAPKPKPIPQRKAATGQAAAALSEAPAPVLPATEESPEPPATEPESAMPEATEMTDPLEDEPDNSWPADTRLSYHLKGYYRGDFYGSGQVQWQHSEGHYQVKVDLRAALFFTGTLISQGELTDNGLQPHLYEERHSGRVRHLRFDSGVVTFNDGSSAALPHGLQDTASQFVELARRFSTGRQALVVGAQVPVWLARPQEMNLWTYDVVALETLQIPEFGEVPAFHLRPRPVANPRGVIRAELWFAPSLQYLPVRIRINLGNDNFADLLVNRIDQGAVSEDSAH